MEQKSIYIKEKRFDISISSEVIQKEVRRVAGEINRDLKGKNPIFICVLNGAFMFAGDLMKLIEFPCEISFVKLSSYSGMLSSGTVKDVIGLNEDLAGRQVVVVEDIVDTGVTMEQILQTLKLRGAADVKVCTFFQKPDALTRDINVDYVAMKIPNDFIVGYGLDYDGHGRNYPEIYTLAK